MLPDTEVAERGSAGSAKVATRSAASFPLGRGRGARFDQLDALRAFALLAVLLRHFWPAAHPGLDLGYRAVRLFFVLSGFLITGILLRCRAEVEAGRLGRTRALFHFYVRRFLRIFPAYYLVLAVCWVLAFPDVREGMPWHLAYGSNVLFALRGIWPPTTSHLWSLSVEEQFYLVWPMLILLAPRRILPPALFLLILIGPLFRLAGYFAHLNGAAMYVLPMSSLDSLGIGAWLALRETGPPRPGAGGPPRLQMLCLLSVPIVLVAWANSGLGWWPVAGYVRLTLEDIAWAFIYAWIIARAVRRIGGPIGKVLDARPVIYLGRISYGVYLIHLFVPDLLLRVTTRAGWPYPTGTALRFLIWTLISVGLAAASWHLYEQPINRLKRRFPYAPRRSIGVLSMWQ